MRTAKAKNSAGLQLVAVPESDGVTNGQLLGWPYEYDGGTPLLVHNPG